MSVFKNARVSNDMIVNNTLTIGATGTDYVWPGSRGNNGEVPITDGSGTVTWQIQSTTGKIAYNLATIELIADQTSYTEAAYFTWDNSEYSSYTTGVVRFFVDWTDSTLDVRLRDLTNETNLGSLTSIGSDGVHSFAVINPVADASVALQIRNNDEGSTDPIVRGATLEYVTSAITGTMVTYTRTPIDSTDSPYTILSTDEIIGIDTSIAAVTVILPEISTIGGNNQVKYFIIDESGDAGTNNITINTIGGDTINDVVSPNVIAIDNTSISLYSDGTSNWVIF